MKLIDKINVDGKDYYLVNRNYLKSLLPPDKTIYHVGGVILPKDLADLFNVWFEQDPTHLIELLKSNPKSSLTSAEVILPTNKLIKTLIPSNTLNDAPWIHSRSSKVRNVLVTNIGFGEIVSSIRRTYNNANIDIFMSGNTEEYPFVEKLCKILNCNLISNPENNNYDAIFIDQTDFQDINFNNFRSDWYSKLTEIGEIILLTNYADFNCTYEAYEDFRTIFNEYGYASSIKGVNNILTNKILLHIRKGAPDYAEYIDKSKDPTISTVYPNVYVYNFMLNIMKDINTIFYIAKCRNKEEKINLIRALIYKSRLEKFLYLPKLEEHIDFIIDAIPFTE